MPLERRLARAGVGDTYHGDRVAYERAPWNKTARHAKRQRSHVLFVGIRKNSIDAIVRSYAPFAAMRNEVEMRLVRR